MTLNWDDAATWQVLIVDDEQDNLELLSDVLQYYGASVVCTESGAQTLERLQTFTPNLIILDLGMPEMNGWQLRERIRELTRFMHIPILALSAHAMVGDREKALDAGFDGYLSKPISVGTLIPDIRNAILNRDANG